MRNRTQADIGGYFPGLCMTEIRCYADNYLREFDATVVGTTADGVC